ncbi:MAG: tRNA-dihydrouridine synthase, partial [Bacilli bacterium]
DVFTPEDAKRLLSHTGCDGVMIGRAALGNPWMLYRTIHYLETGELLPDPIAREKIEVALIHMDRLIESRGEKVAIREMRKHAAWYLKGLRGSAQVREIINLQETRLDMERVLLDYVDCVEQEDEAFVH